MKFLYRRRMNDGESFAKDVFVNQESQRFKDDLIPS